MLFSAKAKPTLKPILSAISLAILAVAYDVSNLEERKSWRLNTLRVFTFSVSGIEVFSTRYRESSAGTPPYILAEMNRNRQQWVTHFLSRAYLLFDMIGTEWSQI